MFEQTFVNTSAQTRRPWTVAASVILQSILVTIAFLAPLVHVAALRRPDPVPVWLPPQTVKEEPPRPAAPQVARTASARPVFAAPALRAPIVVPPHIEMAPDAPEVPFVPNTFSSGSIAAATIGALPGPAIAARPAPAVAPQPPRPAAPVHIGGSVQSAKLVFAPKPAYPRIALTTRTQGTVRIEAIIGRDGSISNLQVLSGHPLLIEAAKEAVRQWRYQPTLLNGEPVEVITDIEVTFTIGR